MPMQAVEKQILDRFKALLHKRLPRHQIIMFGSQARDPFLGGVNYTGSHVNKAARIEPITPPGQVPLPKKSGIEPLYVIRRSHGG
jgi:class 3 adenylate cyclase